jgi:Protein of unknown function (DUF3300)
MNIYRNHLAWLSICCMVCSPIGLEGCGSKDKAPAAATASQPAAASVQDTSAPAVAGSSQQADSQAQAQPASAQQPIQLPDVDLTPAGLDELLAPIALYPDPVVAVMLQASVDPQQVMDGGNWLALDQNQNLKEAALDQASQKAGFTPVMQALLHYPSVIDMMCTQFDWTKQLGAAYSADPKSVLGSVQRLRAIAVDNGALKTSAQMKVNVTQDQGQDVVQIAPANPKVIYVPQYDPQQVFSTTTTTTNADGSSTTTTTTNGAAPSTNTTVVVQQQAAAQPQQSGVSTGDAVLIGLLSFGAGIALGAAINSNNYYYPRWGYGGVYYGGRPYYPPPYRPYYGGGWGPSYGYNRPVHYGNNNIYINNNHYNNNYYNRFNNNSNLKSGYKPMPVHYNNKPNGVYSKSMGNQPGSNSGAKYNRPNNGNGNGNGNGYAGNGANRPSTQPARPGNTGGNNNARPANNAGTKPGNTAGSGNSNWKGQSTYQGNKAGNAQTRPNQGNAQTRPGGGANTGANNGRPGGTAPGTAQGGNKYGGGNVDRGYGQQGGGRQNTSPSARPATGNTATRPATGNNAATRPNNNNQGNRPTSQPASRPQQQSKPSGAFSGSSGSDRSASNRGRESMGAQQHSFGGGGGNKGAAQKRGR